MPPSAAPPRLGGFKLKVKLPPRQQDAGGAGAATTPTGETGATTATNASSFLPLKRPAEGPPAEDAAAAGGIASPSAAAPPHKLKITLK